MPPPPPPPPAESLSGNEDGAGGAPAPAAAKKPWSKPVIRYIEEGELLDTESGPTDETREDGNYFIRS